MDNGVHRLQACSFLMYTIFSKLLKIHDRAFWF